MKFRMTTKLNDGKSEAPPFEFDVTDIGQIHEELEQELYSDEGVFIPVGTTIEIERLA